MLLDIWSVLLVSILHSCICSVDRWRCHRWKPGNVLKTFESNVTLSNYRQRTLKLGRFLVALNLLRRRLPDINDRQSLLMLSRDLLGREAGPTRQEIPVHDQASPPGATGSGPAAAPVAPKPGRHRAAAAASASPKRSGKGGGP